MLLRIRQSSLFFFTSVAIVFDLGNAAAKTEAPVAAAATDQFITWTYKETPMGLFLPKKTSDKPLPIVMFLHGCHNDPVSRYLWIITALNEIEPCAVFLPTAPETKNTPYTCADWGGTYDSQLRPQMINALTELDSLIALYGFDTKRQYLYGESMGGEGVYRLLMDFPTRFAGAVSAAGYTINKGAAKMAKTPLWIVIGAEDEMSPVDSSRAIYKSIVNSGGTSVKYTEYPGLTHVAGIEQAREEPEIVKWLLTQNRSTGIIRRSGYRENTTWNAPRFSLIDGNIHFSSPFPNGTVVKLFDLNGKMLLRTEAQCNTVSLPIGTIGRTVVWNVSNSQFTYSGKVSLCQW
jgi:poly(3-hydroxybutyrate) depolymerase